MGTRCWIAGFFPYDFKDEKTGKQITGTSVQVLTAAKFAGYEGLMPKKVKLLEGVKLPAPPNGKYPFEASLVFDADGMIVEAKI